ncbi:hypothetical protein GY45DRAFT_427249 [Cubamyces sp. BRFM 1775]|nr:hypothetical protein GY45DRAFT_427249 [Cubamyces sp. BRFM 1775]
MHQEPNTKMLQNDFLRAVRSRVCVRAATPPVRFRSSFVRSPPGPARDRPPARHGTTAVHLLFSYRLLSHPLCCARCHPPHPTSCPPSVVAIVCLIHACTFCLLYIFTPPPFRVSHVGCSAIIAAAAVASVVFRIYIPHGVLVLLALFLGYVFACFPLSRIGPFLFTTHRCASLHPLTTSGRPL